MSGSAEKFKAVIVQAEGALESRTHDVADARMSRNKSELKGIGGVFAKIFKHNLFRDAFRQAEILKARKEIRESGNLYSSEQGSTIEEHKTAMAAVVQRFASDYEDSEMLHAGEWRKVLNEKVSDNEQDRETKQEVQRRIKDLIREYARGEISAEIFQEEKVRIFSRSQGKKVDVRNAVEFADNLLEIAEKIKAKYSAEAGDAALDFDCEVIIGKAKAGVRTEAQFNTADRIVEKLRKWQIFNLVNETTLAMAVSTAYSLSSVVAQRVGRSKVLALATFGGTAVLGGVMAGIRERDKLAEERKQHSRERAEGRKFDDKEAPRRTDMEEYQYKTEQAEILSQNLQSFIDKAKSGQMGSADITMAMGYLADVEARILSSDEQKIDLISYSDVRSVEQERTSLDMLRAEAKIKLRKAIIDTGYTGPNISPGQTQPFNFDEQLVNLKENQLAVLRKGEEGMEQKDRLFNKMRRSQVGKKALMAFGTGLLIGGVAQEVHAAFNSEQVGVFGNLFRHHNTDNGPTHYTLLRSLFGTSQEHLPMTPWDKGDLHAVLPKGYDLRPSPDGTFQMVHGNNLVAEGLKFGADGHLDQSSFKTLADRGFSFSESSTQTFISSEKHVDLNPSDYANRHPELFHTIKRDLWYDNDTPKPIFDKNELKLWWGGQNNTGLDGQGHFAFNVSHMTPDGSYHEGFSADAQKLMHAGGGKLKLLLSLSRDSQNQVYEVPIDADGEPMVDMTSDAGKLFFKEVNGHAQFIGGFAEVAQSMPDKDGVEHFRILATYVGEGRDTVPDIIPGEEPRDVIRTIFNPPDGENVIDVPPVIPIVPRTPLERMLPKKKSERGMSYYGYGSGDYGLLSREKYLERMSKSLAKNPEVDITGNDAKFIKEYLDKQSKAYIAELKAMIKGAPSMDKGVKVVITVPAYQEGANMEKTLRNYARIKNRQEFEIVILENHPKNKNRDDTLAAIDKIKAEFPDLKIVHLYKVFDEKPKIGNVRKYLTDAVLLRKQMAGINESVVVVSNDADLEDISPDYVENISAAFAANPKLDAVGGKWDFPEETFKQFPLLHASQRLWHYLDIVFRFKYVKSPELIGRNSAFRSGTYAAIGGYNEKAELAEDLEIGWLIKKGRNYNNERIKYLNNAWLISNPRRAINQMVSGGRLIQQYGDFHVNEEVRKASIVDLLRDKKDFDPDVFKKEVSSIYDHYKRMKKSEGGWVDDKYLDGSFDRAMRFAGVGYEMKDGEVMVTNISKLARGLRRHQEIGRLTLDLKNEYDRKIARSYASVFSADKEYKTLEGALVKALDEANSENPPSGNEESLRASYLAWKEYISKYGDTKDLKGLAAYDELESRLKKVPKSRGT